MTTRVKFSIISCSVLLTAVLVIGGVMGQEPAAEGAYRPLQVYSDVLRHIKSNYVCKYQKCSENHCIVTTSLVDFNCSDWWPLTVLKPSYPYCIFDCAAFIFWDILKCEKKRRKGSYILPHAHMHSIQLHTKDLDTRVEGTPSFYFRLRTSLYFVLSIAV